MKESKYNFFIEDENDGKTISYNARTNALAKMEKEKYEQYTQGSYELLDEELKKSLIYGGFILDDEIDEINILKSRMYASRYSSSALGLTIAPTLKCNFRCPYCYETGEKPGKMSKELQEKIASFLEARKNTISSFSVAWYGGEPLLALDVIENLSKKFVEICEENNIKYGASIVTNAYLLDKETALKLKNDCKVNSIQITLDGPPKMHNKTRILHNGEPTFDKIIENMKACKDILPKISIRVNVSKNNYLEATEVVEILKKEGLSETTAVYFANVSANDDYDRSNCFTNEEFDIVNMLFKKEAGRKEKPEYPSLKGNFCCADNNSSYVLTSDGGIYKCWEDVGIIEREVGNLLDDEDTSLLKQSKYINNTHNYVMYDPTEDEMCKECKMLPICLGGCPIKRLQNRERCIPFK
ncbi:MAG: radical SAM protein, partial [Alkaliphilus sp.]